MLGIIINPKSGKKAFRAQRIYLWKLLRRRHQPFAYRVTKYAGHAIELARELVEKGYDEILILGGDGTLSEAINGIMRSTLTPKERAKIQVGLMPRGTGNDWGRYWNLDKRFKESLRRFFEGEGHPIDIGCVTYWRNNIEHHRYFINSVGFGVDPLCCQKAEKLKYYIGSHHVNYVFGLIAAIIQHKAQHMILTVDGKVAVKLHTGEKNGPNIIPREWVKELMEKGIKIATIGDLSAFPESTRKVLEEAMEKTRDNKNMTLVFAMNYGGRKDIVDGINRYVDDYVSGRVREKMTEELFNSYLSTAEYPEIDLMIRTSLDYRLSNFLLWQLSYTELYFTDTYWPDFTPEEFEKAIKNFTQRSRRFGGLKDEN